MVVGYDDDFPVFIGEKGLPSEALAKDGRALLYCSVSKARKTP